MICVSYSRELQTFKVKPLNWTGFIVTSYHISAFRFSAIVKGCGAFSFSVGFSSNSLVLSLRVMTTGQG